ncbi:MAG: hypothetical protein IKR15_00315 [Bacteroidales bacterium]|nr:hypothetical protein [Bacteroidales bacterium]
MRLIALLAVLAGLSTNVNQPMKNDSKTTLASLWKEYEVLDKADKPAQAAAKLKEITDLAIEVHSPYDFYQAGSLYIDVVARRNWKERGDAVSEFSRKVREFDCPIVSYRWLLQYGDSRLAAQKDFLQKNAERLKADKNPRLWINVGAMSGVLKKHIVDDYEYVLWNMMFSFQSTYDELDRYITEDYPKIAYLKYYYASRSYTEAGRKPKMEAIVKEYAPKAVSFYARENLLGIEFGELKRDKNSAGKDFKAFYEKCRKCISEKNALTGEEATIVGSLTYSENTCRELTDKDLQVGSGGDSIEVRFRNLPWAEVTMHRWENGKKGKQVGKWNLKNSKGSFYVIDIERIKIPALDDGDYVITAKNGKIESTCSYRHYTISLAHRWDSEGYRVYAADFLSGKPIPKARFSLYLGNKQVKTKTLEINDFALLPEDWASLIDKDDDKYYTVSCEYKDASGLTRRSERLSISQPWDNYYHDGRDRISEGCRIFKDRGAYNPGDTLKFKVVVYKGNYIDNMAVSADLPLEIRLLNTESKEIAILKTKTNSFGSAAGSFELPKDQRGGIFYLSVKSNSRTIGSDSFRVDEFVLPTFWLTFDPQEELFLPGAPARMSGRIGSYSGHSLTGATLDIQVNRWNTVVFEDTATAAQDGTFTVEFPAMQSGAYRVKVKVTDATGETIEASNWLYISDYIKVDLTPVNGVEGTFQTLAEEKESYTPYRYRVPYNKYESDPRMIIRGSTATLTMDLRDTDGNKVPGDIEYALVTEKGDTLKTSKARSGDTVDVDLGGLPDGLYTVRAISRIPERKIEAKRECLVLKQEGDIIDGPVGRLFLPGKDELLTGEDITMGFGSVDGPTWAVATLFGNNRQILESRTITLNGDRAVSGNMTDISFEYKEEFPEAVRLVIFYFKKGKSVTFDWQYTRKRTLLEMPLSFDSITEAALPSTKYSVTLSSAPGVEAVAAVFDKSIDAISPNVWDRVYLHGFSAKDVNISTVAGRITGLDPYTLRQTIEDEAVYMDQYSSKARGGRMLAKSAAVNEMMMVEEVGAPLAAPAMDMADSADTEAQAEADAVTVRTSFESALAFEPFLRSDASGRISFDFTTSGKLSTYYVKVYAHDKDMRNALVEKEIVVSLPVKVSLIEPGYLYEGDILRPSVSVSNSSDAPVSGKIMLYVYPGKDYDNLKPTSVRAVPVTVAPNGVQSASFEVPATGSEIGLKAVFVGDRFSDAMFVSVPVRDLLQTLTESHSAILLPGMKEKEVLARLRRQFVNAKGSKAEYSEITILDMVKEAIPSKVEPQGKDVLSLTEALYVRLLSGRLAGKETSEKELIKKIMACHNSDGGFAWYEGMESSRTITAVVMERFWRLRKEGFELPDIDSAAKFLDRTQFGRIFPTWCGWLSDAQYMYVRSLYSEVPFAGTASLLRLAEFRKEAEKYLVPAEGEDRGLKGRILDKARRLRTLQNLAYGKGGARLASEWGVRSQTISRLQASLIADSESLLDYAVKHPDGGWYYPNAVMPWRGLLESEAYAHSLLCDLMSTVQGVAQNVKPRPEEVADGIRLWLMLQKETQKWGDDPAFVEALCSIMDGSDEVLATKVMVLKAQYTKPFVQVKASGNGFTLERRFFREVVQEDTFSDSSEKKRVLLEEILPGAEVAIGTKIIAEYRIWSQENRSFVRLKAYREAGLRPVDQLSGRIGWWMRPLFVDGWYSFSPQGYREVKTDRTEYSFDTYPEESTTITEAFFATQSGTFKAPVIEIESLYAPHYRANAGYQGELKVK